MRIARTSTLFLLLPFCAWAQMPKSPTLDQILRLQTGNYWIYNGTVEWTVANTTPAHFGKKKISWKVEVLEHQNRGELKAFLVNGSFGDLPWFQPGTKPGKYFWIVYQDRFFIKNADADLLKRFHDDAKDQLSDVIEHEEPVLQMPLRSNECTSALKPEAPRERTDLMYCWYLGEKSIRKISAAGVPNQPETVWTAWYRTNPDHEALEFAPNIGFVGYDYSHHGTVSEAHVRLVQAHLSPAK